MNGPKVYHNSVKTPKPGRNDKGIYLLVLH